MVNNKTIAQITVRRATQDDIPFLAWCNYEATSPAPNFCYWDPLLEGLNTDTMTFIQGVLRADALAWGSVSEFFIIEQAGRPVAGASGFVMDKGDYRPLKLSRLPVMANILGWNNDTLQAFQHRYEAVWSEPLDATIAPTAAWVIECVAVIPEARGRGLSRLLIKALLDEGKNRGHNSASISVTTGNEAARKTYEAVGFQMYMSYGADYFDGAFPGTTKYRIHLN